MMRNLIVFVILWLMALPGIAGDLVIETDSNDPDMSAAIETAITYLPQFLDRYDRHKGEPADFGVKVEFPVDNAATTAEVIWVTYFDRLEDGSFVGRLSNEPNYMPGFHLGSNVRFAEDMIVDWYINENGKVFGYFTVRVLLPKLSPEKADSIMSTLHDNPVPDDFLSQ